MSAIRAFVAWLQAQGVQCLAFSLAQFVWNRMPLLWRLLAFCSVRTSDTEQHIWYAHSCRTNTLEKTVEHDNYSQIYIYIFKNIFRVFRLLGGVFSTKKSVS